MKNTPTPIIWVCPKYKEFKTVTPIEFCTVCRENHRQQYIPKSTVDELLEAAQNFLLFHGKAHSFECQVGINKTCDCGTETLFNDLEQAIQNAKERKEWMINPNLSKGDEE